MASVMIDDLPLETLQLVAHYLNTTHRRSLYAFGLANKNLHRASLRLVFQEVHLAVRSRESLQRDVDALVKVLSGADSASYVRHLSIKGGLVLDDGVFDGATQDVSPSGDASEMTWFRLRGVEEVLGDEEPFLRPVLFRDEPAKATPDEDAAWAPVVRLVKTLPFLTKLVYNCRNQFPPSLLDALHQHQPQCRLYHLTFRLGSLASEAVDPHEMAIATSPCLYSVKASCPSFDSHGEDDFNEEAMREIVAGLAPNLREASILRMLPERVAASGHSWHTGGGPWRGLPGCTPGLGIGSLTSLTIAGSWDIPPGASQADFAQHWTKATDFSSLRHLALGGGFEYERGVTSDALAWIAQNCSLAKLETLRIRLSRHDGPEETERPNHVDSAVDFFAALPPLRELSVSGALGPEILGVILSRHGRTLEKLGLRPFEHRFCRNIRPMPMVFDKGHILQIQAQCPVLRDLAISIKRTKSDMREAEMYKSLGDMEQLQNIFLTLDCSDWRVTRDRKSAFDPSFDEIDRRTYSGSALGDPQVDGPHILWGHLREAFMNCAVDEALARSIWEAICRGKSGRRLRSLKLHTTGGGSFGSPVTWHGGHGEIVDHLSRSWRLERGARDDGDSVTVKELGRRAREARDRELTERFVAAFGEDPERSVAVQILRRVWPRREGSRDWREDWASLPLRAL